MSLNYCFVLNFVCNKCCLVWVSFCFHFIFIMWFITVYYVFLLRIFTCYYGCLFLFILFLYLHEPKKPKPHLYLHDPHPSLITYILSHSHLNNRPYFTPHSTHVCLPPSCMKPSIPFRCPLVYPAYPTLHSRPTPFPYAPYPSSPTCPSLITYIPSHSHLHSLACS